MIRRIWVWFLLLAGLGLGVPAGAQQQPVSSATYWQYDASGPLGLVAAADFDLNGVAEFIATTEEYKVVLLNSSGREQWRYATPNQEKIHQLTPLNLALHGDILLATDSRLILLSRDGNEIWQKPIAYPPIPTILLTGIDEELEINGNNPPAVLLPFPAGTEDHILVALQNGLLQCYDGQGDFLWQYPDDSPTGSAGNPQLFVADFAQDEQPEIVLGYTERFGNLVLLNGNGQTVWQKPISGRMTALALTHFNQPGSAQLAVGNSLGRVQLFGGDGQELWLRTPNRPVTSLAMANLAGVPALLVGTDVGGLTAYDGNGSRIWQQNLSETPDQAVSFLSASPLAPQENQAALLVTMTTAAGSSEPGNVLALDSSGRVIDQYPTASISGQTRLVDINQDGINELLLASFGTLALVDPGSGARKNATAWEYRLNNAPESLLVADIDQDRQDELLVSDRNGRLHMLEGDSGQVGWIEILGGTISQLALVPAGDGVVLAVANNIRTPASDGRESLTAWLRLLLPNSQPAAEAISLEGAITDLVVGPVGASNQPQIVVSLDSGLIVAFTLQLTELWRATLPYGVKFMLLDEAAIFATTSHNAIYRLDGDGPPMMIANYNLQQITGLFSVPAGTAETHFLLTTANGQIRALNAQGVELWQQQLESDQPLFTFPAGANFLITASQSQLFNLDALGDRFLWRLDNLGQVTDLYWGDLDGGGGQDLAIGNSDGHILLYTSEKRLWGRLNLGSDIVRLTGLHRRPGQPAELVTLTDNGIVQLFEAKPNRPPLLLDPHAEPTSGQYNLRVNVLEEEEDIVQVGLEIFDAQQGEWTTQSIQNAVGNELLTFSIVPTTESPVQYRFRFDDGAHQGLLQPPAGPPAVLLIAPTINFIGPTLLVVLIFSLIVLVRQAFSSEVQVNRFYRRLKQNPAGTLELLEAEFNRTHGSSNFLLNLANRARLDGNLVLADLANGLFLLMLRPEAALPILNGALDDGQQLTPPWSQLELWRKSSQLGQSLLQAPSTTELSLFHPHLQQLVKNQQDIGRFTSHTEALLNILSNIRDSQRVDLAEDRLVYLHEATALIRQLRQTLANEPILLNNQLVSAIVARWFGLVKVEIENLRGQARLVVQLKTRQVIPKEGQATIALEILNTGRAAAETITLEIEPQAAYESHNLAEMIPLLPPGRAKQVQFNLTPNVTDRFRLVCTIHYQDRSQEAGRLTFADMVHLLPPARPFNPIPNPYTPGTPLRQNSTIFYGREELFEFIAQNAGQMAQRNVLILVGQRRSGKTSALLRLSQHLPEWLLPVYIDCQSLGVMPGMAALFHDLAWLMADALAGRGYKLQVPELAVWRDDPAGQFQRHFMPTVRGLLPAGVTLLLVFDEFEAFENLVNDAILPPTFFTYMRHLMQHSQGFGFIFVGTRRLEEMSSDYWSVLFNIALYRQIGFLSPESARRLICEPVTPHILYDDLAIDKILRVTAGHPYFLQLVCYTLVNQANNQKNGYVTISDVNAALAEMLRLGEVHFAYLWQRSSHIERALLTAVAHLMERDLPFRPADLVQYLEQYDLHFEPAEVTNGLNLLVERDIMREVTIEATTLYELKIGLVGLWVAQNKSLSKLLRVTS